MSEEKETLEWVYGGPHERFQGTKKAGEHGVVNNK
jgi:hypothetical protein